MQLAQLVLLILLASTNDPKEIHVDAYNNFVSHDTGKLINRCVHFSSEYVLAQLILPSVRVHVRTLCQSFS